MEKLLLTIQETADALGVGRARVYDLIRLNELVSVKLGGSRRVPVQCLRAYVDKLSDPTRGAVA